MKAHAIARARAVLARPSTYAVVAVLAVVIGGLLFALLRPREYLTGGNSVRPLQMVAVVDSGERACVDDVEVPAGTAGVELAVGPVGRPGSVVVTLQDGGRVVGRGQAALTEFGRTRAMFGDAIDATGRFRICLRPSGATMNVAGRDQPFVGDPPTSGDTLSGVPSLWFVPPAGERRSLASEWAAALERATVLKPRWLSGGLLLLVMSVLVPLALVGGVVLVARPTRWAPALIVLISFASSGSWALLTVPFDGHDEPDHFAYVQSLVERGVRPDGVPGDRLTFSSAQVETLDAVRHFARIGAQEQVPPWSGTADRALDRRLADEPARDNGGGYADSTRWHAPLYYATASVGYRVSDDVRTQLIGARLLSALLASIIALCAFGIVREIAPRHVRIAVLAGAITAFQPGLSFIGGVVNNDTGANAAAAVMAYLAVRLLCRGPERRTAVALAAVMAAAPFLKGTALALYPPVLAALAFVAWRARGDRAGLLSIAAVPLAFAAVWAGLSAALSGFSSGVETEGAREAVSSPFDAVPGRLSYAWQTVLPRLPTLEDHFTQTWPFFDIYVVGTWGVFGWYTVLAPRWLSSAAVTVGLLLLAVGAVGAWRHRSRLATWGPAAAFLIAVPIVVLAAVAFAYYAPGGSSVPAEQGRYLFTAAAPIGALAALSLLGLPSRWRTVGAVAFAASVAGAAAYTRLDYVGVTFAGF